MKKSVLILPVTLTVLVCLPLLAAIVVRVFWPQLIFPRLEITGVVLLCLAAQVVQQYPAPRARHSYPVLAVLGALIFGALPYAAGFVHWQRSLVLAGVGAAALAGTTFLFTVLCHRQDSGPPAPLAPVLWALCLYLAVQPLRGVLL